MKGEVVLMLLGEDIRVLRKEKGLRLVDLANKIMSVQLLSKFERGECSIGAEKLLKLLDRMNFFSYEMEDIYLIERLNEQLRFFDKLEELVCSVDIDGLVQVISDEKNFFLLDGNFRHKFNVSIVEQRINMFTGIEFEKRKINILTKYLLDASYWWGYEIILFKNIIFCLENEMIELLYFKLLRQYNKRECQGFVLKQLVQIVVEIVKKELKNRSNIHDAQRYVDMALKIFIRKDSYFEKNELSFWRGICLVLNGDKNLGEKTINAVLSVTTYMGDITRKNYFLEQINTYLT